MEHNSQKSVANSLETEEKLLPYMPYLLQDLWAIGCSVDQILNLITKLDLPTGTVNILDLGCGKGALSVQIAARFGFNVTGADAMPEFLRVAEEKSNEYNVASLCTFINEDILNFAANNHDFNIVILAALGGIFGNNKTTIEKLRTQVSPGGYIIIDDGYLKKRDTLNRKGYAYCRNYEDTVKEFTFFNDSLISEISTTEFSKKINAEYLEAIEKRYAELITQHPQMKNELKNYLDLQREECEILNSELEGMIWVLQKAKTK
jgi:2-polyprenyl-3-methyl-5-hydroxy-6-metoxy-1,4-benzoquinol methylase